MIYISKFMNELCTKYGFDTNHIKPFFGELVSRSQIKGSKLNIVEVIDILKDLTGQDTTQIFKDYYLYF